MSILHSLTFGFVFVATEPSLVFSSIHFDEVEFYDPNKILDESTSNGFVCAHLGEQCQISAQCCGVGTCALPSWSETPVCLVPGYKHDERFKKRFLTLHNLRPADIQYIRDSYNTSQYDFLLTDLTFSAPPLEVANKSLETKTANNTVLNNSDKALYGVAKIDSAEPTSSLEVANNTQMAMASPEETYEQNFTFIENNDLQRHFNYSTGSVSSQHLFDDYTFKVNRAVLFNSSTNSSQSEEFGFKNHFMFLLMNNTFGSSDSKLDINEFNDRPLNTDMFKDVVKQLRAKLKEINELEKKKNDQTENSTVFVYNGIETDSQTTERIKTTKKFSKWKTVRKFFSHRKKILNNSFSNKSTSNLKEVVEDIIPTIIPIVKSLKSNNRENIALTNNPDNLNYDEEFKKIFKDVDKIENIIDRDRGINTFHKSKAVNEGLLDFYNIDVPFSSFDGNSEQRDKTNNSLESVFKDIGETINSIMNSDSEEPVQKYLNSNTSIEGKKDNKLPTQDYTSGFNQTPVEAEGKTWNKTYFWDKIHFWKVPKKLSAGVEKRLKQFFFPKNILNTTTSQNKTTPLNEYFLLNFNSNNSEETVTVSQSRGSEKPSEIDSSSESESFEDLYNNSYVFMMHKEHFVEPVKVSSWRRVANLFHREKETPLTVDVNVPDIPENSFGAENYPSETKTENHPTVFNVPKIIHLPEHLMPQVLDQRQSNETDWFFEDSEDYDGGLIESKSSNSSFLFFFNNFLKD